MNTPRTPRKPRASEIASCGGCDATWTATAAAHCAAAGCHQTFSSVTLFDRHRSLAGEHGACKDPALLVGGNGDPICEFRDGMWRFPEMTDADKAARFGDAA